MIHVEVTESLNGQVEEAIHSELRRFNLETNAAFFAARELPADAPRPLFVVARSSEGQIAGGLLGLTQFSWLKVDIMAVMANDRGQGIGSRLLAAAESEARQRGCRHSYVDTMQYQAPGFYEKLGYQLAGRLPNWDSHGHAKFLFVKDLEPAE